MLDALASGGHAGSLREYFGGAAYEELSKLAMLARTVKPGRRAPRVLILPGIMGSKLGARGNMGPAPRVLWVDPLQIAVGGLKDLMLPGRSAIKSMGVILFSYAKLRLKLQIAGCDVSFAAYDWRLGVDELGAELAARIRTERRPVAIIAHSMGGLVARMAASLLPRRCIRRLIMLGTPNNGSFAPVQALRGTYPFVRKMSMLDRRHSPEYLAEKVFRTFPGIYHMLPSGRRRTDVDLLDPRCWPGDRPAPSTHLLDEVLSVRARLAPADARMTHIVGVNRPTVVNVRRSTSGFAYDVSRNGDGTVPLALAALPALKTYYVDEEHGDLANNPQVIKAIMDLLRCGRTAELAQRWVPKRGPLQRVDDAQLSLEVSGKINWQRLSAAQRAAALGELDSGRVKSFRA